MIQIRNNTFLPRMILMFPIVIMLVIPWVTTMEVKNIQVTIVDQDCSTLSRRMIHRVEASQYFKFKGLSATYDEALKVIEHSNADVVLVIPQHYERDQLNGKTANVLIAANAVNGSKGGIGSAYLSNMVSQSITENHVIRAELPFSTIEMFNPHKDYKVFMIPALICMVMVMMCGFLPTLNIVSEKETGTIEQINVTPISKLDFILSKLIPYWLIAMVVITECFILSWLVYGIVPAGSIWVLYLLSMVLALIFSGIGLIISNYSDAMQQAMLMMWFVMVCVILLSGLFTPISSMPDWAQTITMGNPLRYFIDAMRTVFVRGGDFHSIVYPLSVLVTFAIVIDSWAVFSYKKIR